MQLVPHDVLPDIAWYKPLGLATRRGAENKLCTETLRRLQLDSNWVWEQGCIPGLRYTEHDIARWLHPQAIQILFFCSTFLTAGQTSKPSNAQTSITLSGNKSRRESPGMRLAARVTLPVLLVQCVTIDTKCHAPQFMAKMCHMVVYTPRDLGHPHRVFSYTSR